MAISRTEGRQLYREARVGGADAVRVGDVHAQAHPGDRERHGERERDQADGDARDGIPPELAMMLTTRIYMYYFVVETLFGVQNHYGLNSDDATKLIAEVLTGGILKSES